MKTTKTGSKKLSLNKESVRTLTSAEIAGVRGMTGDYCLLTPSCRFVCTKVY
jgi:hypothetical protein